MLVARYSNSALMDIINSPLRLTFEPVRKKKNFITSLLYLVGQMCESLLNLMYEVLGFGLKPVLKFRTASDGIDLNTIYSSTVL